MSKLVLTTLLFVSSAGADYVFPPGVWEQLERGSLEPIQAKIRQVKFQGGGVLLSIEKITDAKGNTALETYSLCTHDKAMNNWNSEAERAMALNLRVQALREAEKSREIVRLGLRGPWQPCVWPIESV